MGVEVGRIGFRKGNMQSSWQMRTLSDLIVALLRDGQKRVSMGESHCAEFRFG